MEEGGFLSTVTFDQLAGGLAHLEEDRDVWVGQILKLRADIEADYIAVLRLVDHELDLGVLELAFLQLKMCQRILSQLDACEEGLVRDLEPHHDLEQPVHEMVAVARTLGLGSLKQPPVCYFPVGEAWCLSLFVKDVGEEIERNLVTLSIVVAFRVVDC